MPKDEEKSTKKTKVAKKGADVQLRHNPLHQDLLDARAPVVKNRAKRQKEEEEIQMFVNPNISKKILSEVKKQQDEHHDDENEGGDFPEEDYYEEEEERGMGDQGGPSKGHSSSSRPLKASLKPPPSGGDDSDLSDLEENEESQAEFLEAQKDEMYIDPHDEELLSQFMPKNPPMRRNLADLIMAKIKEKETERAGEMSDYGSKTLDPRVVKVYRSVGQLLSTYRSGKLPKPFKIIPSLKNWEEIVFLTSPERWTAASMYAATNIFASNMNYKMAQRFYNLILLPRIRDDIAEYKRLNFQLFMALKKAIFKPAAFFKGIILPMCEAGDCTLREAVIVCSVLSRTSIPVLHSSAAILKIAEMPYSGANSIFLRVLMNKKYALPYRVIDALVFHFYNFLADPRTLPVLWHQSLLVFVQRYKEDITSEQKDALLELIKAKNHYLISIEIRRELLSSKSRDNEVPYQPAEMLQQQQQMA